MTKQDLVGPPADSDFDEGTEIPDGTPFRNKSMNRLRGLMVSPLEMTPGEKLKRAMELASLGLKMKWQTLRRESPAISKVELQQQFEEWLYRRDTAPLGDCPGRHREVP